MEPFERVFGAGRLRVTRRWPEDPLLDDPDTIESSYTLNTFAELGLAAPILEMLAAEGYSAPTPIQAQAIPHILAGRDLLGIAQTGTGKTAAFALPLLHRLAADNRRPARRGCRVLVLAPTRELASQIAESFRVYGRRLRLSVTVVFGGVGSQPQVRATSGGVDILVATPGRLLDHVDQGNIRLDTVEFLVLDEVDRMLDMGFIAPVRRIVRAMPRQRQTVLLSATLPADIRALAAEMLNDPTEVAVAPTATTVERVDQRVIHVQHRDKPALLASMMGDAAISRALVFTRTKRGADRVTRHLEAAGVGAAAIHGNKSQGQREHALASFRSGAARVLVATDIAARGIDVDGVTHVINFELPNIPESYVHRIGRTARAGATGTAISFCDAEERAHLRDIETLIRRRLPAHDHRGALSAEPRPLSDRDPGPAAAGHAHSPAALSKPAKGQPKARTGQRQPSASRPAAAPRNGPAARPAAQPRRGANGQPRPQARGELTGDLSHLSFLAPPQAKQPDGSGSRRKAPVSGR